MPGSTSRMDANRIVDVIVQLIKKHTRSMAMVETTWGEVASIGAGEVSVKIYGSDTGSDGFRVIGGGYPDVGDFVKVAIDRGTGDRWVMEPIKAAADDAIIAAHGDLSGLDADDHPQYTTAAEAETIADTVLGVHTSDTVDAHDASAVSLLDAGNYYSGTTVEDALQEIGAGGIGGGGGGSGTIAMNFVIDGGTAAITTGSKGMVRVPVAATLVEVALLADQSGSIVVDIRRTPYADYQPGTHPVSGDSIIGGSGTKPTISSTYKSSDTTFTSWADTTLDAGDILEFYVDSATTIRKVTVYMKVTI